MAEALAERDVALGLGRGGAVLAATEDAARSSDAPIDGGATLDVVVRSDGTVSARVARADGDAAAWGRVADAVARALDPRKVRVPPGSAGWHVVVRVDAKLVLPDGRNVKSLHGVRAEVAPSRLAETIAHPLEGGDPRVAPREPNDYGGGASDPAPAAGALARPGGAGKTGGAAQAIAGTILPTPTLSVSGKVCSASLSVTPFAVGLGGGCSLENIGGAARRIVSGHIVSEGGV